MNTIVAPLVRILTSLSPRHAGFSDNHDFLARISAIVDQHIADTHFTTTAAAACMSMSRMHLNRKLCALTGQSTHEYIRAKRLETAREALLQDSLPIAAVASTVGFKSPSHFIKAFRQRFGTTPSRFRKLKSTDSLPSPPHSA